MIADGQGVTETPPSCTPIISQLNESTPESLQQLVNFVEQRVEQAKREIVSNLIQCLLPSNIGQYECNPANSCREIKDRVPNSPSGHYYIKPTTGPTVRVYCKMTSCDGVSGPWMRVANFNADNTSHSCPSGLQLFTNTKRRCGMPSDGAGCASTMFDIHGIPYRKVCGKVIGYQEESPDALRINGQNIEGTYVDGVSLTHRHNPRHHIWTFVAAVGENDRVSTSSCSCTGSRGPFPPVPSFIGSDYFCDSGSRSGWQHRFFGNDPLWDGAGCGRSSTCCSFNGPPWFLKQLSSSTSDDLELRVCRDEPRSNEDVGLKSVELYVQ